MDITLRKYLEIADNFQHDLFNADININDLSRKIKQLQRSIRTIQAVSKRLADVSDTLNKLFHKNHGTMDYIETYPTQYDHAVVRNVYKKEKVEIIPNISINAIAVENISEIPISNVYYITKLNQFAININGLIIKGNIGNILNYGDPKTSKCQYGNMCKTLNKQKECKYYHDPEDYKSVSTLDKSVTNIEPTNILNRIRNFTHGSWIYDPSKKKFYTRKIGNRDTLISDIASMQKSIYNDEVCTREAQLMHDVLIYVLLFQNNLIEKYTKW